MVPVYIFQLFEYIVHRWAVSGIVAAIGHLDNPISINNKITTQLAAVTLDRLSDQQS